MTDFAVTGKKRAGKGLFCAGLIRDALKAGRPVATNMDIFPEHMLDPWNKSTFIRIPDVPTVSDLESIGVGNQEIDDETNGILVLDETSKFFNARSWGDKERQPMLDWLIHSGKLGWDVYYQMQGLEQVDKQLRTTQAEYHIGVKCTKRWPIPFVSAFFRLFGLNVHFPKMHVGIIKHGFDQHALTVGRKWYRAKELYNAYDTRQKFLDRSNPSAVGLHTVLSPWHIKGRYLPLPPPQFIRFIYGMLGIDWIPKPQVIERKGKHALAVLLSRLPERQAIKHFQRLDSLGAFSDAKT